MDGTNEGTPERAPGSAGRRTARAGRRPLRTALAVAVAGAAVVGALGALPDAAEAGAPAKAPAATAGAALPFTSQEAEDATTDGTVVGPDHTQGTLASEASGRKAVKLAAGQSVDFELKAAANAVDVAYNVPDGQEGSLAVRVNGEAVEGELTTTSRHSYLDTPWIAGSTTHHLFADTRLLLGRDAAAGDTVTLTASAETTVDVADFEQVAAPAEMPSGAVSVVDHGADPTGAGDSAQAFRDAIAAARGGTVWIPEGDFTLGSELNGVSDVTIQGAGNWHSVVRGSRFVNQTQSAGNVHLKDFAVFGDVTERVDGNADNFVNGSLGANSSVSGMWVQNFKVGLWLTGTNDGLEVTGNRILGMAADGLNLNGTAKDVTVSDNFLRNTGDDALAMWSLNAANERCAFTGNTVVQPNLANGIAIYGGTDITVSGNLVKDTNALGSGIAVSNQKFLDPFFPLSGTITVSGNELVRTGALNPNWKHPMGALRVDAYDSAIEADVRITDTTVRDSPWSVFEFVSGGGKGLAVQNVTVSGATVENTGTVAVQAETRGEVEFSDVVVTGGGAAGVYNCPFPEGSGTFTVRDGGGNSGWDTEWPDCATWPEPGGTGAARG
ncbi:glycosyl hydrolase family 28-related protein [Streptomyces sp. Z26]|uniref:glycosyl hydrolase family 28-related protein n=1 Tax=Streptomyces sp. Z26 TaxID=2500177 RepID=UPI000EF138EE|nr:glycosyl hydrolase family 28-related protein [Streptomyces sp. Z26]RLL69235.1 mycodextranase [Streptomyces sp. Z26]